VLVLKRRFNADHATPKHELIFFCADIELLSAAKAEGWLSQIQMIMIEVKIVGDKMIAGLHF